MTAEPGDLNKDFRNSFDQMRGLVVKHGHNNPLREFPGSLGNIRKVIRATENLLSLPEAKSITVVDKRIKFVNIASEKNNLFMSIKGDVGDKSGQQYIYNIEVFWINPNKREYGIFYVTDSSSQTDMMKNVNNMIKLGVDMPGEGGILIGGGRVDETSQKSNQRLPYKRKSFEEVWDSYQKGFVILFLLDFATFSEEKCC